jgi:multicomponent Na+:H+ antiporter subunit E
MRHWRGFLLQFSLLMGFWLLLSDEWRPLFFAFGAASAAAVTALTHHVVATVTEPDRVRPLGAPRGVRRLGWLAVYVGWMLGRILVASSQVAYFALHPGLPFRPRFVRFRTELERPLARVALASSITLVPGTTTVRIDGDELLVHTLIPGSADDLASGRMQAIVARAFGEVPEPPPEMHWGELIEEAVR